jgi:hypothetical protein
MWTNDDGQLALPPSPARRAGARPPSCCPRSIATAGSTTTPLSTRSISTRLALAASRSPSPDASHTEPPAHDELTPAGPAHTRPSLEEVLALLDQVADDADALNRIQALLANHTHECP